MNPEYRYILEKGNKKHHCPECNKKTFVLYIDTETGNYLPEYYGRCDRESKCNYHLNPYTDGYAQAIWEQEQGNRSELPNNWKPQRKKAIPQHTREQVFFDLDIFKQTLQPERYEKNIFIQNLLSRVAFPFDADRVTKVIELYRLGTVVAGYMTGATTFPYIDPDGNVRAIQVKQFDEQNHTTKQNKLDKIILNFLKKSKKEIPEWLTKYIDSGDNEGYYTCLFGAHLLPKHPNAKVFLFEAPKTAIYSTLYFGHPERSNIISLAVYNKSSFSFDKIKVLQGRFIYVFPDLSIDGATFQEWATKAKEYEKQLPGTRFIFSDLLERLATPEQREAGADLADVMIKHDWREFKKQSIQEQPPPAVKAKPLSRAQIQWLIRYQFKPKGALTHSLWIIDPDRYPELTAFNLEALTTNLRVKRGIEVNPQDYLQAFLTLSIPEDWMQEITEIENYFNNIELPTHPIKLNDWSTVSDHRKFIDSHIARLKTYNGNQRFLPFLQQLRAFKSKIELNRMNHKALY